MSQSASHSEQLSPAPASRQLLASGGLTGFGLGAAIDVILFHLILQHHHLLSGYIDPATQAGLRENILYDGVFLLVMLVITFVGIGLLWRVVNGTPVRVSNTFVFGAVLVGAGVFNVIDGVGSHYILGAHDVVHDTALWNPHWVIVSVVLLGGGITVLWIADSSATEKR